MAESPKVNFAEVLANMLASRDEEKKTPSFKNPAKYARHVLIDDQESLDLITSLDALKDELDILFRKARSKSALLESKRQELFLRLAEVYPIVDRRAEGTGYRFWKDQHYYVAWDEVEEDESTNKPEPDELRRQYL